MDSPISLRKTMNTPRRTPEVAVTPLPPGFTEGQHEKIIEDRQQMNLLAKNDEDGTFIKLAVLNVNLVGTILDLRQDISANFEGSKWKDKFYLMKETLTDIPENEEDKLTVSEIYSSGRVLIRWESVQGQSRFCVCGLKGRIVCVKCNRQYYCSLHCQVRHWQRHQTVCKVNTTTN
ncbi:uncharacterized protein [Amphiura filiformis]|uniref:uncharacterized protein n=1 Tax=Amphiura filiformis TaxID=82378 RepID=UPI003B216639